MKKNKKVLVILSIIFVVLIIFIALVVDSLLFDKNVKLSPEEEIYSGFNNYSSYHTWNLSLEKKEVVEDVVDNLNIQISYPKDWNPLTYNPNENNLFILSSNDKNIEINGSVFGSENFISYSMAICKDNICKSDSIELINQGLFEINEGVLGKLNVTKVIEEQGDGFFELELKVNYKNEPSRIISNNFWIVNYLPGWPKNINYYIYSSTSIADLDNDGNLEVVVGGGIANNEIYVLNSTGDFFDSNRDGIPEWPYIPTISKEKHNIYSSPAIGDLNNDDNLEIFIGEAYGLFVNEFYGTLYGLNKDATPLNGWPVISGGGAFAKSPTISNINNDNTNEILQIDTGPFIKRLRVFTANGNPLDSDNDGEPNWPVSLDDFPTTDQIVVDLNNDLNKEVIFSTRYNLYVFSSDGKIYDGNGDGIPEWPKYICSITCSTSYHNGLVVGDLNNNGDKEIVLLANSYSATKGFHSLVHVFNKNGEELPGFPVIIQGKLGNRPALADINGDGHLEIIGVANNVDGVSVFIIKNDGLFIWERGDVPLKDFKEDLYYDSNAVIVGDIDSDNNVEIVIPAREPGVVPRVGKIFAWNVDKTLVDGFPKVLNYPTSGEDTISLTDLNKDGYIDIVGTSVYNFKSNIYAINLNETYNKDELPWPMFQHDIQHTGCYDCNNILVEPQCVQNSDCGSPTTVNQCSGTIGYITITTTPTCSSGMCIDKTSSSKIFSCNYGCTSGKCNKIILTCNKILYKEWSSTKCNPADCGSYSYLSCEQKSDSKKTSYREKCSATYNSQCSENAVCDSGDAPSSAKYIPC